MHRVFWGRPLLRRDTVTWLRDVGCTVCLHLVQAALLFALLARRRKAQQAKRGGLAAQVRDTLRYTAFLGAFAGVYVAVDESLAALFGNKRWVLPRAAVLHFGLLSQRKHAPCGCEQSGPCFSQDIKVAGGSGGPGSRAHHPADRVRNERSAQQLAPSFRIALCKVGKTAM